MGLLIGVRVAVAVVIGGTPAVAVAVNVGVRVAVAVVIGGTPVVAVAVNVGVRVAVGVGDTKGASCARAWLS